MAIYHLHIDSYRRSRGRTAIGGAAYRRGLKAACRISGKRFNFRSKGEVVFSEFVPAQNDPTDYTQFSNLMALYEAIEQTEKHPRATLGREIEAALPHELTLPQQVELVRSFVAEVRQRFGAEQAFFDFSIHAKAGNQHVHICMAEREQSAPFVFKKTKRRDWDGESFVRVCREIWQSQTNAALEQAGINQRVDCRSHVDRGMRLLPSLHEGKAAYFNSEVKIMNDIIREQNKQLQAANEAQAEPIPIVHAACVMEYASITSSHPPYTAILLHQQYGQTFAFSDALSYVNLRDSGRAVLHFKDKSKIEDFGGKVVCHDMPPADGAERIIALALAKKWAAVSFDGDEAFLRAAFILALENGITIQVKDARQQGLLAQISMGIPPAPVPAIPTLAGLGDRLKKAGNTTPAAPAPRRRRAI